MYSMRSKHTPKDYGSVLMALGRNWDLDSIRSMATTQSRSLDRSMISTPIPRIPPSAGISGSRIGCISHQDRGLLSVSLMVCRCGIEDGSGEGSVVFVWRDEEGCVVYQEEQYSRAGVIVISLRFSNEFSEFSELRKGGSRGAM